MKVLGLLTAVPKKWWLILASAAALAALASWQIDTIERAAVNAWQGEQLREELRSAEQELQRERAERERLERIAAAREQARQSAQRETDRLRGDLRALESEYEDVQRWARERIPEPVLDRLRQHTRPGADDPDGD